MSDQLPDENSPDHFEDAVTTSLEALDRQLQKEGIGYTEGSTVSLALVDLEAGTLATADLGDSHAFLGVQDEEGGDIEVSKLSHAHKPSEPSEKKRIEDAGGTVEFIQGAHRVGMSKSTLFVNVSISDHLAQIALICPGPSATSKQRHAGPVVTAASPAPLERYLAGAPVFQANRRI